VIRLAAATAGLALLAAACGSTTRAGTTGSNPSGVAFASCMRSHGVLKWPDPNPGGGFAKESLQQLGVSASTFQAAQSACRRFLPNGGAGPTPAEVQQVRAEGLHFAECVRAHGVPGFPDPGRDGRIPDPGTVGINQGSPVFQAANQACGRYRPPYMPSNAAYNAYVQAHGQ
jgi:hypothetical protein